MSFSSSSFVPRPNSRANTGTATAPSCPLPPPASDLRLLPVQSPERSRVCSEAPRLGNLRASPRALGSCLRLPLGLSACRASASRGHQVASAGGGARYTLPRGTHGCPGQCAPDDRVIQAPKWTWEVFMKQVSKVMQ